MDLRPQGIELFDRWTAMWNGELALAARIMAPAFRLRYAQAGSEAFDECTTPDAIAKLIGGFRDARPGLMFSAEGEAVVDLAHGDGGVLGLVARPYLATMPAPNGERTAKSGTDILRVAGGRITEVWSVSASRTFYR
jgi:hypothetical protein